MNRQIFLSFFAFACIGATQAVFAHQAESVQSVLDTVNRLYNVTSGHCQEPDTHAARGHYYCSGLLVRTVEDNDYLPWTFSPQATAMGASSYSWIRADVATTRLLRQAGFILRNAREAGARGLPAVDAGFMCLFAIDGSTAAGRPLPHYGCEHRKDVLPVNFPQPSAMHRNIEFAWGQCEAAGILTHEQWVDFRQGYPDTESSWAQCSWNVDRPEAWDHAILEHRLYGAIAEDFYIWNELLLRITDDGSMLKDKIAAFFYDPNFKYEEGESLPQAQNFQRKLDAHGYQVPVLRVDFKAPASQRFSYHPEDQVIPLW